MAAVRRIRGGVAGGAWVVLLVGALISGPQADHPANPPRTVAPAVPAQAPPARSLASATGEDRRYALANGCYALRGPGGFVAKALGGYSASAGAAGEGEAFRMQATDLGRYLFYGRDRDFMAAGAAGVVAPPAGANPSPDW